MRKLIAAIGIVAVVATLGCVRETGSLKASQSQDARTPAALETPAGPVLVRCASDQRALIRRVAHDGEVVAEVECVAAEPARVVGEPEPLLYVPPERPVRYVASAPAAPVVRPVAQRTVAYAPARRTVRRTRSGKDSALIIAGSTAAGAGVGAIVDGKKGALIGALIGGGAGTIFDRTTRHK